MLKRCFDIVFSILVILITAPFWIIVACFIKFSSPGPVFYIQYRVGRKGIEFPLFKFRTMYVNADRQGLLTVNPNEHRITSLGKVLRKLKIDEWPQFINVLFGQMSVVGPRPEVAHYVQFYTPEQRKVLSVRPGITDYASIKYFEENKLLAQSSDPEQTYLNIIMPDKLKLNIEYVNTHSLGIDIKIIFKTCIKILF